MCCCQLTEELWAYYQSYFCWGFNSYGCAAFMIMCLFSVYQPIHVNFFLCVLFNSRSCRPSWQPRNCLRDWRSLWGATLLTVAPWLPTERFTMKEPSSPQRRTDPGRPELGKPVWPWPWGKQALDLAIRTHQTGFSLQGQEFLREEKSLCIAQLRKLNGRLRNLIVIQFVLDSVVSVQE